MIDDLHVLDPWRRRIVHERAARDGRVVGASLTRFGVARLDQTVRGEVGIECDVEQTALIPRVDGGQPGDRLRELAVGADDSQAPGPDSPILRRR